MERGRIAGSRTHLAAPESDRPAPGAFNSCHARSDRQKAESLARCHDRRRLMITKAFNQVADTFNMNIDEIAVVMDELMTDRRRLKRAARAQINAASPTSR